MPIWQGPKRAGMVYCRLLIDSKATSALQKGWSGCLITTHGVCKIGTGHCRSYNPSVLPVSRGKPRKDRVMAFPISYLVWLFPRFWLVSLLVVLLGDSLMISFCFHVYIAGNCDSHYEFEFKLSELKLPPKCALLIPKFDVFLVSKKI